VAALPPLADRRLRSVAVVAPLRPQQPLLLSEVLAAVALLLLADLPRLWAALHHHLAVVAVALLPLVALPHLLAADLLLLLAADLHLLLEADLLLLLPVADLLPLLVVVEAVALCCRASSRVPASRKPRRTIALHPPLTPRAVVVVAVVAAAAHSPWACINL